MTENSQSPLKKSAANLQRGFEAVGGKLILTASALRFDSHLLNIQRGSTEVDLRRIVAIRPAKAMFFGLLPISDNAFVVTLADETTYRFIVRGRDEWMKAIADAIEAQHHA
jgi:hypothetical protein